MIPNFVTLINWLLGLEEVKQQFLSIKAKVDTVVRQNVSLKDERFGAVLLGNPGTGKDLDHEYAHGMPNFD
jgi:hypothetical protein